MDVSAVSLGFSPPADPTYYFSYLAPTRSGPPNYVAAGSAGGMQQFTSWGGSISPTIDWSGEVYTDRITAAGMIPVSLPGDVTINVQISNAPDINGSNGIATYAWLSGDDHLFVWYSLNTTDVNSPELAILKKENIVQHYVNNALQYSGDFFGSNGVGSEDDGMAGANSENFVITDDNAYPQVGVFGGNEIQGSMMNATDGDFIIGTGVITFSGYNNWGPTTGTPPANNGLVGGWGLAPVNSPTFSNSSTGGGTSTLGPFIAESDSISRMMSMAFASTFFNVGTGGVEVGDPLTSVGMASGDTPNSATLYNGRWYIGALNGSLQGTLYISAGDTFDDLVPSTLSSSDPALSFLASGFIVWALWNEGGNIYAVLGDSGLSQFVAAQLSPSAPPPAAPYTNHPLPPVLPAACIPACGE